MTSTITRAQFEQVRGMLEANRKVTRPRQLDLYEVFSAVLHRLFTGCAWRNLPPGSPPWRSVHQYFTDWTNPSTAGGAPVLPRALAALGIHQGEA